MDDADAKEPSFGRLVFGKALSDTAHFLRYTRRDVILAVITLLLGIGLAYVFVGKADTVKEMAFIAAFTFAPAGIVMFAIFIWHLWLAPSALAYEAAVAATKSVPAPQPARAGRSEKQPNWAIWKQHSQYDLTQLAAILAKKDPNGLETSESKAYLLLLQEDAMCNKLRITRSRLAEGHQSPDLWPAYFDVQKAPALEWAKARGFDLSHIE